MKGLPVHFLLPVVTHSPKFVLVLEAPNKEDVDKQEPLSDRAGVEFAELLRENELQLNEASIIHAVACMRKQPEADPEMRIALQCCAPLFWKSLSGTKVTTPTLVVGKWAAAQVNGVEKAIGSVRGFYDGALLKRP